MKGIFSMWSVKDPRSFTPIALLAIALVASGCGGGGSPSLTPGGRLSPNANIGEARAAAAQADPRSGSVTQSSDTDSGGVTRDVVNLTIRGTGKPRVTASYNGTEVVDTADATERSGVEYVRGQPGKQYFERFTYGDWHAVEFYRGLQEGDLAGVPAGDIWIDVYTDFGGDPDGDGNKVDETDWLAGGIWVYIPAGGTAEDYEFGAFADAAAPLTNDQLGAITSGTAEYSGGATGVYHDGSQNHFFDASVTLSADFANDTISGSVHTVKIDDQAVAGNPVLSLGSASFAAGNFFKGATSMTYDGDSYSGKWGGQFANLSSDAANAVGGTFGAASAGGNSLVGAFGGYKQP